MKPQAIPGGLRAWLLVTGGLSYPIAWVFRCLHKRMGAPSERFAERLGKPSECSDSGVIWFHAASLGEVMQIGPLVKELSQTENASILVTTTTQAGAEWVARELPGVHHQFGPIDIPSAVAGFLDHWTPRIAIFVEGDFGPRLVMENLNRGIPQVLLNARHSRTRERFPITFARLLAPFSLVTCRSEAVSDGLLSLGLSPTRVKTLPDLRIASPKLPAPLELTQILSHKIYARPVWLAASTHPGDEQAVLAAHRDFVDRFPGALLIIARRHPKRGAPLQDTAKEQNFMSARRSQNEDLTDATEVYIADTLGELGVFFTLVPLVFVGGSYGTEGGHNPYEPASFGTAIVSGPHVKNFADAYAVLTELGAAMQEDDPAALGDMLADLMQTDQAAKMGQAGQAFMSSAEDSIATHANLISDLVQKVGRDGGEAPASHKHVK